MARLTVHAVFGVAMVLGGGTAFASSDSSPEAVVPAPEVAPLLHTRWPWRDLAMCEATGNWAARTGNGYYGGLQQDLVFWRRYGGPEYAPRPDLATPEQQVEIAIRGQAVQGWAAWPVCSRRLGLR